MKFCKLVCLLLCALFIFGCFIGCGKTDTATQSSPSTNTVFSTDDVKFIDENNESVYDIVRPENGAMDIAGYLFKQMKEKLGIASKNISDSNDGSDKYEILVGFTNRPESATAKQYLIDNIGGRSDDYIIATIGKKIVILGMTEDATQKATEYFVANYLKIEGVRGGVNYTYATEGDFINRKINDTNIGKFVVVKQRFNESYVTQYAIEETIDEINEKTGYELPIVEDHIAETDCEIIVGDCSRGGVAKVTDRDTYTITISGKKVYLNGGSPSSRAMAVSEFAKMLLSGDVTNQNSLDGSYAEAIANYDKTTTYTLSWNDDFDTPSDTHPTGVDLTKWAFSGDGAEGHNGRKSVRSQDPNHLFVDNGMLNFYASYDEQNYYGFKIQTYDKTQFRYGILEMSAILPHGDAFWIALWAGVLDKYNPVAFSSEINVVEMFGNSATFASNLHGWKNKHQTELYESVWAPLGIATHWSLDASYSNDKKYACPEGNFNDGFHTFSYVWTENMNGFACDGNLFFSIDPNEKELWKETFSQPIFIILSQATCFATGSGRNMADDAPEWQESNNFQIDYVHVYQKDDGLHTLEYLD